MWPLNAYCYVWNCMVQDAATNNLWLFVDRRSTGFLYRLCVCCLMWLLPLTPKHRLHFSIAWWFTVLLTWSHSRKCVYWPLSCCSHVWCFGFPQYSVLLLTSLEEKKKKKHQTTSRPQLRWKKKGHIPWVLLIAHLQKKKKVIIMHNVFCW